jgi:hypothetical protein
MRISAACVRASRFFCLLFFFGCGTSGMMLEDLALVELMDFVSTLPPTWSRCNQMNRCCCRRSRARESEVPSSCCLYNDAFLSYHCAAIIRFQRISTKASSELKSVRIRIIQVIFDQRRWLLVGLQLYQRYFYGCCEWSYLPKLCHV